MCSSLTRDHSNMSTNHYTMTSGKSSKVDCNGNILSQYQDIYMPTGLLISPIPKMKTYTNTVDMRFDDTIFSKVQYVYKTKLRCSWWKCYIMNPLQNACILWIPM
jgi:hypothetical protein